MTDLISRQAAITEIQGTVSEVCMKSPYDAEWFTRLHDRQREIVAILDRLPTIDAVEVGSCDGCVYSNRTRPQKCSCCRRNRYLKDCYEADRREENAAD